MRGKRIFQVIPGRATTIQGSSIWIRNLCEPLKELGYDVFLFEPDQYLIDRGIKPSTSKGKDVLSNDLLDTFTRESLNKKFDYFFSYLHSGRVYPEIFNEIKRTTFTINYTTNYHQFSMYKEIAKIVDVNIYVSKVAKEGFDKIGAKSYWMPFAANPGFYKPSKINENDLITFIGSPYGNRPYCFWRVLQNNINLQIYGPGWQIGNKIRFALSNYKKLLKTLFFDTDKALNVLNEMKRRKIIEKLNNDFPGNIKNTLSDEDYFKMLASSSIIININESRYNHEFLNNKVFLGCNLRDFETTMSGSFSLTQFSDELQYFFEEGKEVVSFKNEYELVDKIKYYSRNKIERDKIALAGYKRAINEHTWKHRFKMFFNWLDNNHL